MLGSDEGAEGCGRSGASSHISPSTEHVQDTARHGADVPYTQFPEVQ